MLLSSLRGCCTGDTSIGSDRYVGRFSAINPRTDWEILILIMSITARGHIAVCLFGPRFGLPLAGLASGFVSSVATHRWE
jgi:uncharacterized membrane protein (DUF4010 family)